jgi:hypothetical protein
MRETCSAPGAPKRKIASPRGQQARFPPHRRIGRLAQPHRAFGALESLQVRQAAARSRACQVHRLSATRAAHRSGRKVVATRPCTPFNTKHETPPSTEAPSEGTLRSGPSPAVRLSNDRLKFKHPFETFLWCAKAPLGRGGGHAPVRTTAGDLQKLGSLGYVRPRLVCPIAARGVFLAEKQLFRGKYWWAHKDSNLGPAD